MRNFDLIINEHAYQKTIPKKLKNKTTEIKDSIQINFEGAKGNKVIGIIRHNTLDSTKIYISTTNNIFKSRYISRSFTSLLQKLSLNLQTYKHFCQ